MSDGLDRHLAEYAHREVHARTVAAPPEIVWAAIHAVTAAELTVTRTLMALRALPARALGRGGRPGPAADAGEPFLERFRRGGWCELESREPRIFAAAAIGRPWDLRGGERVPLSGPDELAAFDRPGYVRMAMAFELAPAGDGTRLRTETRVAPTDPASARAFARYWLVIRGPSGLIRHDLLRAVGRRAELTRSDAGRPAHPTTPAAR